MHSRQAVISQVQKWLGSTKGSAGHLEILEIYNSQNPLPRGHKMTVNDAWCAATVTAAAIAAGCADIIPGECSCGKMIEKMKAMGIWEENDAYENLKPGDIVFFDWSDTGVGDDTTGHDHVGFVETVSPQTKVFTTIEGNYNGAVRRRSMRLNNRYIRGFGLPRYDEEEAEAPKTEEPKAETVKTDTTKLDSARYKDVNIAGTYQTMATINLRAGAGLSKKRITLIPKGNECKCYGFYSTVLGLKWYLIQTKINGVLYTGFCHSGYLKRKQL